MKCRIGETRGLDCGDFDSLGAVRAHYKDAHPGESTPNPRRKRASANDAAPSAPVDAPPASAPAAGTDEQLPLDVGDTRETMPDAPPGMEPDAGDEIAPGAVGLRERLWSGRRRKRAVRDGGSERMPARRARASTAELLGGFWGGLGWIVTRVAHDEPVGRCLAWQSPVAGALLEEYTRDKLIDRLVLQPLAENAERAELLGSLLGMPILVGLYERAPETRPFVEPLLRTMIEQHLVAMVPVMKKEQAKQRNIKKVAGQLGLVSDDPDFDPVAVLLNAMFFGDEPPADAPPGAEQRGAA